MFSKTVSAILFVILLLGVLMVYGVKYEGSTVAFAEGSLQLVAYVQINITNTQSIATPNPFQVMINVNSSEYAAYEASDLSNVAFAYQNGTMIPSWLETGNSNNSTDTIYWVKVGSVPASSTATIRMNFYNVTDDVLGNVTTGEAPSLSPTYGEYDNGANVFILYGDFNNSLSGWQASLYGGGFTPINSTNGVEMLDGRNGESGTEATYLTLSIELQSTPIIAEEAWDYSGGVNQLPNVATPPAADAMSIGPRASEASNVLMTSAYDAPVLNNSASAIFNYGSSGYTGLYSFPNRNPVGTSSFGGPGSLSVISFLETNGTWASAGYSTQYVSLEDFGFPKYVPGAVVSGPVSVVLYNPAVVISTAADTHVGSTYEYVRWVIVRALPPNDVPANVMVGHTVTVVIPEFSSIIILPAFIIATLLAVIVCRKKGVKTSQARQNL